MVGFAPREDDDEKRRQRERGAKQEEKGESVPRDVWQWRVSGGFSARWPPEAAPRLDKYIVEFNIPTFFKGSWPTACEERRARARARLTKAGNEFFEYHQPSRTNLCVTVQRIILSFF